MLPPTLYRHVMVNHIHRRGCAGSARWVYPGIGLSIADSQQGARRRFHSPENISADMFIAHVLQEAVASTNGESTNLADTRSRTSVVFLALPVMKV